MPRFKTMIVALGLLGLFGISAQAQMKLPEATVVPSTNAADFNSIDSSFLSFEEFQQLAEELSKKVNLFKDVWAKDPKARFFGGTTRDYLYWLKGQFRDLKNQKQLQEKLQYLRGLEGIDVRDFIIGDSDVDVISSNRGIIAAESYGLKKIDFISGDRFIPNTPEWKTEIDQGFIPVEKIILSSTGFQLNEAFGNGIREIYDGRPTVRYPEPEAFLKTHYAAANRNHQILLALRYLRTLAINYFQIYGREFPHAKIPVDAESYKSTKEIVDLTKASDHFLKCMRDSTFVRWLNGTIQKGFRSYTNATAAFALYLHFGVDDIVRAHSNEIEPINQYLFAEPRDEKSSEIYRRRLKEFGINESEILGSVEKYFPNFTLYHGARTEQGFRSILIQGVRPSSDGTAGQGLYGVSQKNVEFAETWGGSIDRVVTFGISKKARILDITQPAGKKLLDQSKMSIDAFARHFGFDIICYPYDVQAFVVKNSGVLLRPMGLKRQVLTLGSFFRKATEVNTTEEFVQILDVIKLSNFSAAELQSAYKMMPFFGDQNFLIELKKLKIEEKNIPEALDVFAQWSKINVKLDKTQETIWVDVFSGLVSKTYDQKSFPLIERFIDSTINLGKPELLKSLDLFIKTMLKSIDGLDLSVLLNTIMKVSLATGDTSYIDMLRHEVGMNYKISLFEHEVTDRHSGKSTKVEGKAGPLLLTAKLLKKEGLGSPAAKLTFDKLAGAAGDVRDYPTLHFLATVAVEHFNKTSQSEVVESSLKGLERISEKRWGLDQLSFPPDSDKTYSPFFPRSLEPFVKLIGKMKDPGMDKKLRDKIAECIFKKSDALAFIAFVKEIKIASELSQYMLKIEEFGFFDFKKSEILKAIAQNPLFRVHKDLLIQLIAAVARAKSEVVFSEDVLRIVIETPQLFTDKEVFETVISVAENLKSDKAFNDLSKRVQLLDGAILVERSERLLSKVDAFENIGDGINFIMKSAVSLALRSGEFTLFDKAVEATLRKYHRSSFRFIRKVVGEPDVVIDGKEGGLLVAAKELKRQGIESPFGRVVLNKLMDVTTRIIDGPTRHLILEMIMDQKDLASRSENLKSFIKELGRTSEVEVHGKRADTGYLYHADYEPMVYHTTLRKIIDLLGVTPFSESMKADLVDSVFFGGDLETYKALIKYLTDPSNILSSRVSIERVVFRQSVAKVADIKYEVFSDLKRALEKLDLSRHPEFSSLVDLVSKGKVTKSQLRKDFKKFDPQSVEGLRPPPTFREKCLTVIKGLKI